MLVELDDIKFSKINVNENSVIMITLNNNPHPKYIDKVAIQMRSVFPDNKVMVIDNKDMSITVFDTSDN